MSSDDLKSGLCIYILKRIKKEKWLQDIFLIDFMVMLCYVGIVHHVKYLSLLSIS